MSTKAVAAQVAGHAHGRVPRELRRTQILAEAYDLFVERGYQGASMEELARRVGVTKPVIYDLVRSKEELFREIMAGVRQELAVCVASAAAAAPDLPSRLRAGILAFLRFARQRREGWAALFSMESSLGTAEIVAMRREHVGLVAQLIAGSVGAQASGLDPRTFEALAQAINGAVEFVALWGQTQTDLPVEQLADLLSKLLSPGLVALTHAAAPPRRRTSATRRRR